VYVPHKEGPASIFLLGGVDNNCVQFQSDRLTALAPLPSPKTFFPSVHCASVLLTFGGYDPVDKIQLRTCESYHIHKDRWARNRDLLLREQRSQAACALFNNNTVYVFGGYNRDKGALDSIEKVDFVHKLVEEVKVTLPMPLRRFQTIKIASSKILIIGGLGKMGRESDQVFCLDVSDNKHSIEHLDTIDKAGAVDLPLLVDSIGQIHLFLEN